MISNTSLLRRIDSYVAQHNLINSGDTIIIGLSGGPDSVFLTQYLVSIRDSLNLRLIAAHLNHGWRPEAEQDVMWCQDFCKSLGIDFVTKHADEIKLEKKLNGSKEELGRKLRRAFFSEIAQEYHAQLIALGHHQDDSIETFFLNLIRGATVNGLQGIKPKQGSIIRPLLSIKKSEILEYLKENNILYLKDYTNDQLDYLRNRIRHTIIPAFEQTDSRYEAKLLQTMAYFGNLDQFLHATTQEALNTISNGDAIDLNAFTSLTPFLQKRVLIIWLKKQAVPVIHSNAWLNEIIRYINEGKSSSHTIVENWKLIKNNNNILVKTN